MGWRFLLDRTTTRLVIESPRDPVIFAGAQCRVTNGTQNDRAHSVTEEQAGIVQAAKCTVVMMSSREGDSQFADKRGAFLEAVRGSPDTGSGLIVFRIATSELRVTVALPPELMKEAARLAELTMWSADVAFSVGLPFSGFPFESTAPGAPEFDAFYRASEPLVIRRAFLELHRQPKVA